MVLWPGLGRREVKLPMSEEAPTCSCLTCAARCNLPSALRVASASRACILLFLFYFLFFCFMPQICGLCYLIDCRFADCAICSIADLRIVRSARLPICGLCDMLDCRFANCAICSLVAEFRADGLRASHYFAGCRWLITLVIRGKFISFNNSVLAPRALLKACSPIARLPRVSLPRVTQLFFVLCSFWWVSTHCGAAVTFSCRDVKRGRHPGSATLHGQSAVSCFPSRGNFPRLRLWLPRFVQPASWNFG